MLIFEMLPEVLTFHDISVIQPLRDETFQKAVQPLFHARRITADDVLSKNSHILPDSYV